MLHIAVPFTAMGDTSRSTTTRLLHELENGNRAALNDLFNLVYAALRVEAHQQRERWQGDHTLNTTALVHEVYLKLVDHEQARWESRAHFMAVAARAMRHLLVDHARRRKSEKRGGDRPRLSLDEMKITPNAAVGAPEEKAELLLLLEDALQRLARINERESQVVECRFFGGMTVEETAAALGVSTMTVKRDWAMAKAWLYQEVQEAY